MIMEDIKKRLATLEGKSVVVEHIFKAIETHNSEIKKNGQYIAGLIAKVDKLDNTLNNGIIKEINEATNYIKNRTNIHTRSEKRTAIIMTGLLTMTLTVAGSLFLLHHEKIFKFLGQLF